MKLTCDVDNKCVIVLDEMTGQGRSYENFSLIKKPKNVLDMFGYHGHPKESFKTFADEHKMTASCFKRIFNSMMLKIWIDGHQDIIQEYGFNPDRKVSPQKVKLIHDNIDIIRQCQKDGLDNLIPMVMYSGMTPQQLKKWWGKSAWKKICKNSKSRNKLVAMFSYGDMFFSKDCTRCRYLVDVPTTILKSKVFSSSFDIFVWWSCKQLRKEAGSWRAIIDPAYRNDAVLRFLRNICRDTKLMAMELDKEFSFDWDLETMKKKHDKYTEIITEMKYSKDDIEWLKDLPQEIEHNGLKATLLSSPYSINMEGKIMHHCVGSYADRVKTENYVVYKIEGDKGERSTLGISVIHIPAYNISFTTNDRDFLEVKSDNQRKYSFNQMYGKCNSMVSDDERCFAQYIIDILNGEIQIDS